MQCSLFWVSHYCTQKGTPTQSNKTPNPTTVVKIQRLTFKYRGKCLTHDYSFLWFAANASMINTGSCKMCINFSPQQQTPMYLGGSDAPVLVAHNSRCRNLDG